jgi:hypothetical protein
VEKKVAIRSNQRREKSKTGSDVEDRRQKRLAKDSIEYVAGGRDIENEFKFDRSLVASI